MGYRDPNEEFDDGMSDESNGEEDFSEDGNDTVLPEKKETTAERQRKSRRTVESYLEKKRLREELESVFDEDEEGLDFNLDDMNLEEDDDDDENNKVKKKPKKK